MLMVKAVALQIKGKEVEEIRKTFNVEDPKWTPEELQKLQLMVKAVALEIQGKTVEEIKKAFNVEDPKWTEEELKKLKQENAWAYETSK